MLLVVSPGSCYCCDPKQDWDRRTDIRPLQCGFTAGWRDSSSSSYSAHQTFFKLTNSFQQYLSFILDHHYRNQHNSRRCIGLCSMNMKLYTFYDSDILSQSIYNIPQQPSLVPCIELQVPLRIKCHLCKDIFEFLSEIIKNP